MVCPMAVSWSVSSSFCCDETELRKLQTPLTLQTYILSSFLRKCFIVYLSIFPIEISLDVTSKMMFLFVNIKPLSWFEKKKKEGPQPQ